MGRLGHLRSCVPAVIGQRQALAIKRLAFTGPLQSSCRQKLEAERKLMEKIEEVETLTLELHALRNNVQAWTEREDASRKEVRFLPGIRLQNVSGADEKGFAFCGRTFHLAFLKESGRKWT